MPLTTSHSDDMVDAVPGSRQGLGASRSTGRSSNTGANLEPTTERLDVRPKGGAEDWDPSAPRGCPGELPRSVLHAILAAEVAGTGADIDQVLLELQHILLSYTSGLHRFARFVSVMP